MAKQTHTDNVGKPILTSAAESGTMPDAPASPDDWPQVRWEVAVTLLVRDYERSLQFYRDLLGLVATINATFGTFRHIRLQLPGVERFEVVLIHCHSPAQETALGRQCGDVPWLCIPVRDCNARYRELRAQGVEFVGEVTDMPWGADAVCLDPDGNRVGLVESYSQDP
jgi:predicted enzyme related to lactoylglutathione lyase